MYFAILDGHIVSVELDEAGKEINTISPFEVSTEDNKKHPFSRFIDSPLLNFVASILDKAFPHKIKSLTSLEKNPQQKYGTSPQYYSQGKELVLEVEQDKEYSLKLKENKVFLLNPMDYCLFPQESHPVIFQRIENPPEKLNEFMYSVNGVTYGLPPLMISEIKGKITFPQVLCSQYLACLNEYYLVASDLQNPEIQKRMIECSMMIKKFLISVACEYLGLLVLLPQKKGNDIELVAETLADKYCFNLY